MKRDKLLLGSALAALMLTAAACNKGKSSSNGGQLSGAGVPPPQQEQPQPVLGNCYGVSGCNGTGSVTTTEEDCTNAGGTWQPKTT